jgi:hypothetical protein
MTLMDAEEEEEEEEEGLYLRIAERRPHENSPDVTTAVYHEFAVGRV